MVNVTERKAVDTDGSPGRTYCFDLRGVNAFLESASVRWIGVGAGAGARLSFVLFGMLCRLRYLSMEWE